MKHLYAITIFAVLATALSACGSNRKHPQVQYRPQTRAAAQPVDAEQRRREQQYQQFMQQVEQEHRENLRRINREEQEWNDRKRQMDAQFQGNPYQ